MNLGELISIKTTQADSTHSGEEHTRYRDEIRLFSCVQQGDIQKLIAQLKNINISVITGKLSDDDVQHYKYLAVSTVTLATRYAIQGGLSEASAWQFSDQTIMTLDSMNAKDEILNYLSSQIVRLTNMVGKNKTQPAGSPHVRKSIRYINDNIHKRITVSMLAEICGISPDYLSSLFKKEIGENLSTYITQRKLEMARTLIMQKKSSREICCLLGFSSQSHFITAFKKYYHMTPTEYSHLVK